MPGSSLPPIPSPVAALRRGLTLRCPRCGQGPMSDGLLKPRRACTACGQSFVLASGEFTGGAYVNYGVTALLATGLFIGLVLAGVDALQTLWALVPFIVVFPFLFQRHAIGLFTATLVATGAMERRGDPG